MVMKVTMLKTVYGSEDAFAVKRFYSGETYDVADNLGAHWLDKGIAMKSDDESIADAMEEIDLRIRYGRWLNDTRGLHTFEQWKAEFSPAVMFAEELKSNRIVTNPATMAVILVFHQLTPQK